MGEFLRQYGAHVAAWVRTGSVVTACVSLAGLWYLFRSGKVRGWSHRFRGVARFVCRSVLGVAIVGIIVAYGPMTPLFGTTRLLDNTVGSPAPDMPFRIVEGGAESRLSEFRGKVVLINLWAAWCPPCRRELPVLNRLQTSYRGQGLVVLTLTDEPAHDVKDVLRRHAPDTVNGTVESFGWLAIRDFRPFTLILDRQGVLRDYLFADQTYEAFEARIRPHL